MAPHGCLNGAQNRDFNRYFKNRVQLSREDMNKSHQVARKYVTKLLQYINKADRRFSKTPIKIGSFTQRLKVGQADEFDFNVPLDRFPIKEAGLFANPEPGYTTLTLPENLHPNQWTSFCVSGCHLLPQHVRKTFKDLLNNALTDPRLKDKIDIKTRYNGPAIAIKIWEPSVNYEIDIDLAPMVCTQLTMKDIYDKIPKIRPWPCPGFKWPSQEKVDAVLKCNVNLVAKSDDNWLISFNKAEAKLRMHIDQKGTCRSKVHRIMKKLKDDVWCPPLSHALTSYQLKNLLFWECEKFPDDQQWTPALLGVRIDSMLERLETCLAASKLDMYFDPRVNLLDKASETEVCTTIRENIKKFRNNPGKFLELDKSWARSHDVTP